MLGKRVSKRASAFVITDYDDVLFLNVTILLGADSQAKSKSRPPVVNPPEDEPA